MTYTVTGGTLNPT